MSHTHHNKHMDTLATPIWTHTVQRLKTVPLSDQACDLVPMSVWRCGPGQFCHLDERMMGFQLGTLVQCVYPPCQPTMSSD